MLFRQKLAFFLFGCVFVVVGQVVMGLVVPSATAQGGLQDAEFGSVRARELIVGVPGGGFAFLEATEDGAFLHLKGPNREATVQLIAADTEADVSVWHGNLNDNPSRVHIQCTSDSAAAHWERGGSTQAFIGTSDTGGHVKVSDRYGEPEVQLYVNNSGDGVVHR